MAPLKVVKFFCADYFKKHLVTCACSVQLIVTQLLVVIFLLYYQCFLVSFIPEIAWC